MSAIIESDGRCHFGVSTDTLGPRGVPEQLTDIYGEFIDMGVIDSVEVLGWRRQIKRVISYIHEYHPEFDISIHGKTGGNGYSTLDTMKLWVIEHLLTPSRRVVSAYGEDHAILFHADELIDIRFLAWLKEHRENIRGIWVENGQQGIEEVVKAVRMVKFLRRHGIKSGLMLDVAHLIGADNLKAKDQQHRRDAFDAAMKYIEDELMPLSDDDGNPIVQGMHVPIGLLDYDSLPITHVLPAQLRRFAAILQHSSVHKVIFENQPETRDQAVGLFYIRQTKQRNHVNQQLRKLHDAGFMLKKKSAT